MKQESEGLPVKVEWDRRQRERRAEAAPQPEPTEHRRSERRREPPFTWRAAEFVVVNEPDAAEPQEANDPPKDTDR